MRIKRSVRKQTSKAKNKKEFQDIDRLQALSFQIMNTQQGAAIALGSASNAFYSTKK